MSSGGLTGGAGGSIAGTSPLPSSWRKQPDGADLLMYMRSGPPKSDSGNRDKPKTDMPTSNDAGVDVPTDEQSQKLQDFDAMQGRGPLVPLGDKDPNKPPLQPAPEPTCEKGSAADVALRGAGGFVEGAYSVVREPVLAVHDAAGAVLHHTGDRVAGTDHFKGHADRTQARIEAITDPVETVKATVEDVGGAIDEAGDGCYGRAADLGGQVAGSTIVPGGALSRILRVGDDRWRAADAPSGKPEGNTPGAAGGADNAGASNAANGPDALSGKPDAGKVDGGERRIIDGDIEYQVTTDKPGWGETKRETDSLVEAKSRRMESGDKGFQGEAKALVDEVAASGAKINSADVIDIRKTPDGRIVWLEKGSDSAGHQHILRHAEEFGQRGISENDIPDVIFTALEKGEIVGYQGKGIGRPIYEFEFDGKTQRVAITVGDNGFIVGANPAK